MNDFTLPGYDLWKETEPDYPSDGDCDCGECPDCRKEFDYDRAHEPEDDGWFGLAVDLARMQI